MKKKFPYAKPQLDDIVVYSDSKRAYSGLYFGRAGRVIEECFSQQKARPCLVAVEQDRPTKDCEWIVVSWVSPIDNKIAGVIEKTGMFPRKYFDVIVRNV